VSSPPQQATTIQSPYNSNYDLKCEAFYVRRIESMVVVSSHALLRQCVRDPAARGGASLAACLVSRRAELSPPTFVVVKKNSLFVAFWFFGKSRYFMR
jgi:hypothetical protein